MTHRLAAVIVTALASNAFAGAPSLVLPWKRARVTHDVGKVGNVGYGNLVDPGDEMGWTLPAIAPGAYRVELEVRTGDRGEGTGFIKSYRLNAPDSCSAAGKAEDIGFSLSPGCKPKVTARGKGYKVFRGRITAGQKLLLHPGDLLRVRSSAHYASAYALILTKLAGRDLLDIKLHVSKFCSLFVAGDSVSVTASAANLGPNARSCAVAFQAEDEHGQIVDRGVKRVALAAASQQAVAWMPRLGKLGPFFVKATLREDGADVCWDEVNVAVVPKIDLAAVPESSRFGLHKSDLTEWPPIGAKWDRLWDTGDTWNRMQRTPGPIDFSVQDAKVRDALRLGVHILFVFAYTPTWAASHPEWGHYTGGGAASAPKDIRTWERYIAAVVDRYRGRVEHFEVWNEPNGSFFRGTVDEYEALLESAYRTAKLTDPDCQIVGISGTGGYLPWMEEVFKRGGLRYMDKVSVHTYTSPSSPEQANLPGRLKATHRLIEKYGGNQPIWNTELGFWVPERKGCRPLTRDEIAAKAPKDIAPNWQSRWPYRPIDEYAAAAELVRHYALNMAGGVEHVFWYSWIPQAFPMFTVRNAPRMHTVAFAGAAARLSDARYVERVDLGCEDLHVHLFRKPDGPMLMAWRAANTPRKIALSASRAVSLWDMWGNVEQRAAGRIELDLSPRPVYLMGPSLAEMRGTQLAGEVFVFEAVDAAVSRDVGKTKAREMTSKTHHGDHRVMGLPDAGDELEWTLKGIGRALYELRIDLRSGSRPPGTDLIKHYRVEVAKAGAPKLTLVPAPDKTPVETHRAKGYSVFYDEVVAQPNVELRADDKVRLRCDAGWGYVGKLVLRKVAERTDVEAVACKPMAGPSQWPAEPKIEIKRRTQAVIGVVDAFASTHKRDSWRGAQDCSATARVGWTADALLVRIEVVDDKHMPAAAGQGFWAGDGVEVFLDLRPADEVGSPALGDGVYQVCCAAPSRVDIAPLPVKGRLPEGASAQGKKTDRGYVVMLALPWPAGIEPKPGRAFGFDIAVDDADNTGEPAAKRKAQLVWRGTANNFQDPSAYGMMVLSK